jgi:hypothetical protein
VIPLPSALEPKADPDPALAKRVLAALDAIRQGGEALAGAAETTRGALGNATTALGRSVGAATESVVETTSALGGYAQSGAATVAGGARELASTVGEGVQNGFEYTREAMSQLWENYPLAVCAGLVGAGVAAGMMLPSTRREAQMMGRTAGQVTKQIKRKGGELLEHGRELAANAAHAITQEGERQGLSPDELGRKVKRVVRSGRKAATAE